MKTVKLRLALNGGFREGLIKNFIFKFPLESVIGKILLENIPEINPVEDVLLKFGEVGVMVRCELAFFKLVTLFLSMLVIRFMIVEIYQCFG